MLELNGTWFYSTKTNLDALAGGFDWIVRLRTKKNDPFPCVILCSLLLKDPCYEVRDKFTKKLHKAEDVLKLPLEYLGIFALAAPEPVKERKTQVITKKFNTLKRWKRGLGWQTFVEFG